MPVILHFIHEYKWTTKDYQVYIYIMIQNYKRESPLTTKANTKNTIKRPW